MQTDVRGATAGDVAAIVDIHARSFRARGLAGRDLLERLESPDQPARWTPRRLASVLVAGAGEGVGIQGFAWWGPAISGDWRDPGALVPGLGELYLIAVDPDRWRTGIGRLLLDAAASRLAAAGFAEAVLWTDDRNEPGRRLYESGGWAPDGARRTEDLDGTPVVSIRYHRALATAS